MDLEGGTLLPRAAPAGAGGLISGTWITVGGRRRHEYQLTERGRLTLTEERGRWREFVATLTAALEPVRGHQPVTGAGVTQRDPSGSRTPGGVKLQA